MVSGSLSPASLVIRSRGQPLAPRIDTPVPYLPGTNCAGGARKKLRLLPLESMATPPAPQSTGVEQTTGASDGQAAALLDTAQLPASPPDVPPPQQPASPPPGATDGQGRRAGGA